MRSLIIAASLLISSAAGAADFKAQMSNYDGTPISDCTPVAPATTCEGPPLTLGKVVTTVLFASFPDEREVSGEEKWKRGDLAMRIIQKPDLDLKAEEIVLVKRLIAKGFSPLIVYRAWSMLDPNASK